MAKHAPYPKRDLAKARELLAKADVPKNGAVARALDGLEGTATSLLS